MKTHIIAVAAFVSAFIPAGAMAQMSEPPPASPPNPMGSTSALYTALSDAQRISQGENLETIPTLASMEAVGYIFGIQEMLSVNVAQPQFRVCVPAGMGADALERIVVKFIDNNPKSYSWPPSSVVVAAYVQAFACRK